MDTDVLAQLIDNKHELLLQIRQLSARQVEFVEADDMARMIQLLAVKQRLLAAMEETERRLDPFRREDPDQRVWKSPAHRQRAQQVSASCDILLQEIMTMEKGCETNLFRRRDEAAGQLQGVHRSAQAANAYLGSSEASGRQFDASCET
jgi:hypothetical protein